MRKLCCPSNNYNSYNSKSNVAKTFEEEIFIPYENIDLDAFINVLDEDVTYQEEE